LPVSVGETIAGKYRVEGMIGEGGMGVVLAARHMQLDDKVAIKLLRPEALEHRDTRERFAREARAAVKIKSPYVARILDVDQLRDGTPYIVMEYLEGETLEQRLDREPIQPIPQVVDWIIQASDAIAEAHVLGIVHRDIKPANLFLAIQPKGFRQIKVLDFGISKTVPSMREPSLVDEDEAPPSSELTKTRMWMGTPNYMAPEQMLSARRADARADIWSLGVTLFELLTGSYPFAGGDARELALQVTRGRALGVRSVRADVPEGLARIVERCLDRDRDKRYGSVAELAIALQPYGTDRSAGIVATIARPSMNTQPGEDVDEPTVVRVGPSASLARQLARPAEATAVALPKGRREPDRERREEGHPRGDRRAQNDRRAPEDRRAPPEERRRGDERAARAQASHPRVSVPALMPKGAASPHSSSKNFRAIAEIATDSRGQKYHVLFELGEGGTSKVLLGMAQGMASVNKLVVLKVLREDIAKDPKATQMFLEEARLSARLNHKNVVEVFEVTVQDDRPVLVMAYLDGFSLREVLRGARAALTREMHVAILTEMLAGLHYSHELVDFNGTPLGVVHRDVSPHNVFVTFDGTVKVLDFGLAKPLFGTREHTRTGVIKGKIRYMAPEQILGDKQIDRRADVYAAGVMLWEAITGRRMWKGVAEGRVMASVMAGKIPSPREFWPECPPELERTCLRALSLKKEQRHASAAELQSELEQYLDGQSRVRDRDVARFMTEHFGAAREERRRVVEERLGRPQNLPEFTTTTRFQPLPEATRTGFASALGLSRAGPWRNAAAWGGASTLALLALLAGVYFARVPAQTEAELAAASAQARKSTIELWVSMSPAHARLSLDGRELQGNPHSSRVPRDGNPHVMRVSAEGYATLERTVYFDTDLELAITLEPKRGVRPPADSALHPAASDHTHPTR
jgi:serine/threonine-protein kinase